MKFWGPFQIQDVKDISQVAQFVTQAITNLSQFMTGQVNFSDNIQCTLVDQIIKITDTPVPHTLGLVPIGFLILNSDGPGIIYAGSTDWNKNYIYLKSSVQVTAKIAVIGG